MSSSTQKDDGFIAHVEELLIEIDKLPNEDEESTSAVDEDDIDRLEIDPHNQHHIELMRREVIKDCNHSLNENTETITVNMSDINKIYDDDTEAITKVTIKPNEYANIYEFNGYLSSIILAMLEYATGQNELYHVHGTDAKTYRVSSYDMVMRHIPPHKYFAFLPSAVSQDVSTLSTNSAKYAKSKLFRSILMKNENVEIVSTLCTLNIDHAVNVESLKLIHDILQLTKKSLLNISLSLRLLTNNNIYRLPSTSLNIYEYEAPVDSLAISTEHYESNMMISCIASILKLCERMKHLERFNFALIGFNRECYDYFTHFDTDSDSKIFPNLTHLTIHIDDDLSQSEVSSFPFYAFAASPILAFLKKLPSLQSVCIIIDEEDKEKKGANAMNNPHYSQQQFTIYFVKKLCEKIFDVLNKSHSNLQEFYFENTRSDCGTSEFFKDMLVHFIHNHTKLLRLTIILYDLCDENLAPLIQSIYDTNYKSCVHRLETLKLCSKICIDCDLNDRHNTHAIQRLLRHHYGDISLSALLHLIYISQSLQRLSLLCFYGADTIKFNALMSAIKSKKHCIRHLEIAQLRKDNDTLYSLSKLFRNHNGNRHRHKLNWNFYESMMISFGVTFDDFYNSDKLQVSDMKSFVDLIVAKQLSLQQSKLFLLNVLNTNIKQLFIPNDVLWIVVEFAAGLDCLNIALLEWNLMQRDELLLLFETVRYFNKKYNQLTNQYNTCAIKHIHRKIQWFRPEWSKKCLLLHNL